MLNEEQKVELEQLKKNVKEVEEQFSSFSDIPMEHDYWKWKNRVRYLESIR